MPRLPRIRLRALDELARQLRFSPRAAAVRHLASVLVLAREIDPARAYGEDWVTHRITGYRAEAADPAQLVGEALLADFSAFAERISAQSRIESSDLDEQLLSLSTLRGRWGISARTIERYRRKGLIGLLVRNASDRLQLAFPASSVARFEREMPSLLAAARAYSRTTPGEQDLIIETALGYRADTGASLAGTAVAVAPSLDVSPGTVRKLLRSRKEFSVVPRTSHRQRRLAFRAWVKGVGASEIADRLKTTRATIHRLINAERAAKLRALDLESPLPSRANMHGEVLELPVARQGLGEPGDTDAARLAESTRAYKAPDAKRERLIAEAYHFLRWRAREAVAALRPFPGGTALDRIETDLRWAALLKVELIRGERALIVRTIEERAGVPLVELSPAETRRWLAIAFAAAAEGVDRFDPSKRGRLATPLSLSLARALAGLKVSVPSRRAHAAAVPIEDWSRRVSVWQEWLDPPSRLRKAEAEQAIRLRFGWGQGPPLTLEQLQREHSISAARLWALMRR